jgi:PAS domain-containing protein
LAHALEFDVGELLLRSGWAGAEDVRPGDLATAEWQERVDRLTSANADLQMQVDDLARANDSWQRWGSDKLLDLRVAEAAIAQLEAVLDVLPDPVVVVSPVGVVLVENEAYAAFSARHTDEPAMRGCDGVPLAPAKLPLERASRGERFDIRVMMEGGDPAVYRVIGRPATTLRGGRIGVVTFHRIPA